MTQQAPVQQADDREREEEREREETAVEDASGVAGEVVRDVDVDAQWPALAAETIVLDVVMRQQRTVGDGHHQPHEADLTTNIFFYYRQFRLVESCVAVRSTRV